MKLRRNRICVLLLFALMLPSLAFSFNAETDGCYGVTRSYAAEKRDGSDAVLLKKPENMMYASGTDYIYGDENAGKKNVVSKGGTYYIGAGAEGILTVDTREPVKLIGRGIDDSQIYENLFINCKQASSKLTLSDIGISDSENTANLLNFTGNNNVLTIQGICQLDYDIGYTNKKDALIHVSEDTSLTIDGSGVFYQYNCTQGAGIGGDTGEMNGDITFSMTGGAFIKGTRQGAVIGAGAAAKSSGEIPGSVTFESGTYNLVSNSKGAVIGGSAGSTGASSGTKVYVKGGSININCDFTGSAVGGGGYKIGNDASGGIVYISGGSLRTYIDRNAANNEYGGFNDARFTEGINDAIITALRKNENEENVYKCVFDTSDLGSGPYKVRVDGKVFYNGGRHEWAFVNESLSKNAGEQIKIDRTVDNWVPNDEPNLYFYLTGKDHTITVDNRLYKVEFDRTVLNSDDTVKEDRVYTAGAFSVQEVKPLLNLEDHTTVSSVSKSGAEVIWGDKGTAFSVSADPACAVFLRKSDGTIVKLKAQATNETNTRAFNANGAVAGDTIIVAFKGDENLDGKVNNFDVAATKAVSLQKINPELMQSMLMDVNGDGKINSNDVAVLKAVSLEKTAMLW